MEDISKLLDLGKDMGLKGSDFADFVNKRETTIRDAEKQKQNIKREERAKDREERIKYKEYKENESQARLKIELTKKQIELAKINADSKILFTAKSPDVKAKIPKLPSYNKKRDNMDSYLKRFRSLCFCSVLCLLCLCARLFISALWSPARKGLTSWLSFVVSAVSLSLSHWYPGSGVVPDCINSQPLHPYLLCKICNKC